MIRFVAGRLLAVVPTLFVVALVTFLMGYLSPSDPVEIIMGERARPEAMARVRAEYGLDKPPWVQFGRFVWGAVHGDLGRSFLGGRPVNRISGECCLPTGGLAVIAMLLAIGAGIPLGVLAALKHNTAVDRGAMAGALAGVVLPNFVIAPFLILLFALKLRWVPVSGWETPANVVLPAVLLSLRPLAIIARMTRSSMLEVLRQDYIRAAYARGLSWPTVVLKHGLRNAILPVLTVIGTSAGYLLTGSFVVETIFGVPGIGKQAIDSIFRRDYPVIQATTLLAAATFLAVNLAVDLLYGLADPRIRRRAS